MANFSKDATKWVRAYSGSIDTTALLLAFEAGSARQRAIDGEIADAHDAEHGQIERYEGWGTIQDAANHYKVSTKTIRRYITGGMVEAKRFGPRLIRVNLASLDAVITDATGTMGWNVEEDPKAEES